MASTLLRRGLAFAAGASAFSLGCGLVAEVQPARRDAPPAATTPDPPAPVAPTTKPQCERADWIAFLEGGNAGEPPQLAAVRADGSDRHYLWRFQDGDTGEARDLIASGERLGAIGASPDGRALMYTAIRGTGSSATTVLRRFDLDKQRLTELATDASSWFAQSRDGTRVAYVANLALRIADTDGARARTLLEYPYTGSTNAYYTSPIFGADARTLYFVAGWTMTSIDVDAPGAKTTYNNMGQAFSMSPDARRFAAFANCTGREIRVGSVDKMVEGPCSASTAAVARVTTDTAFRNAAVAWGLADEIAYQDGTDLLVVGATAGSTPHAVASTTRYDVISPSWLAGCAELPVGARY